MSRTIGSHDGDCFRVSMALHKFEISARRGSLIFFFVLTVGQAEIHGISQNISHITCAHFVENRTNIFFYKHAQQKSQCETQRETKRFCVFDTEKGISEPPRERHCSNKLTWGACIRTIAMNQNCWPRSDPV